MNEIHINLTMFCIWKRTRLHHRTSQYKQSFQRPPCQAIILQLNRGALLQPVLSNLAETGFSRFRRQ